MEYCKRENIKNAYEDYKKSSNYILEDCYGHYSHAKNKAMKYCIDLQFKYNGRGLQIIGYNSHTFSVGFIGTVDGKESFVYITKTYDRYIPLDEI